MSGDTLHAEAGLDNHVAALAADHALELSEHSFSVFAGRVVAVFRDEALNTHDGHLQILDGGRFTQRQLRGVYPMVDLQFLVSPQLWEKPLSIDQRIELALDIQSKDPQARQLLFNSGGKVIIVDSCDDHQSVLDKIMGEDPDNYQLASQTDFNRVVREGYGEMIHYGNEWRDFCRNKTGGRLEVNIKEPLSGSQEKVTIYHRINKQGQLLIDFEHGLDQESSAELTRFVCRHLNAEQGYFLHDLAVRSVRPDKPQETPELCCLASEGKFVTLLDRKDPKEARFLGPFGPQRRGVQEPVQP